MSPNQREERSQHPAVGSPQAAPSPAHPQGWGWEAAPRQPSPSGRFSPMSLSPPARCYSLCRRFRFLPKSCSFARRALHVPAARAQGTGGDNEQCFPIDRLKEHFLPHSSKVLNTKQGQGGAAAQTPLPCLRQAAPWLRLERKGKTPGKDGERKEENGKEKRMGAVGSADFNLRTLTHRDPGGWEG